MSKKPPIIIIGMHRSGTSMVARMLEELGLFIGKGKEMNSEAFFFYRLNNWALRQSGGSWDYPEPVRHFIENQEVRAFAADYITYMMKTPRIISYMGLLKYLRYGSPANLDIPWGWKDPRNTYLLPLWLDIFPDARIIHIYRHGVDVANSLKVRYEKLLNEAKENYHANKMIYWLRKRRGEFTNTLRCASLREGFSLWEEYLREAERHVSLLGDRAMEVKYEDLLAEPYETLQSLSHFCSLPHSQEIMVNLVKEVNKNRAYVYRNSPELRAFAEKAEDRLNIYGYSV